MAGPGGQVPRPSMRQRTLSLLGILSVSISSLIADINRKSIKGGRR